MMSDDNAKRLMKGLGFSEDECSVYFELLNKPTGDSIEGVLSQSKIGSHETQEAVKSLVEKGLLRITSNRLEAAEPKIFVSKIQEMNRQELTRKLETLSENASQLLSILEPLFWETRLGIKPEDILEPLRDLGQMEVKTVAVIGDATREVLVSAETFGWFSKVQEEIYRARERGVKFRVLMTPKDPDTQRRAGELKKLGLEVRQPKEDWYPVRGTLADNKELVFLIWANHEKGKPAKYFRPHFSTNAGMIRVFADAFERRWMDSRQL